MNGSKEPDKISTRMAFVSVSFCGFIMMTLYRSFIGASLAVKVFRPPINSIEELLESPYHLLVTNGTSVHKMFTQAENNTIYNQIVMNDRLGLVKTDREAVRQLKEGKMRWWGDLT